MTLEGVAFDGYLANCGVRLVASGGFDSLEAAAATPAQSLTNRSGAWSLVTYAHDTPDALVVVGGLPGAGGVECVDTATGLVPSSPLVRTPLARAWGWRAKRRHPKGRESVGSPTPADPLLLKPLALLSRWLSKPYPNPTANLTQVSPAGCSAVSPLTTLAAALMLLDQGLDPRLTASAAVSRVAASLSVPTSSSSSLDLCSLDAVAAATAGDGDATRVLAAGLQVNHTASPPAPRDDAFFKPVRHFNCDPLFDFRN
jgi:hypothetical protein